MKILTIIFSLCIYIYQNPVQARPSPYQNECIDNIESHYFDYQDGGELDLSSCNLKDKDIASIIEFSKNHTVTSLYIFNNEITSIGASDIAAHMQLFDLGIGWNPIGDDGVIALANMSKLDDLNIMSTGITDRAMENIAGNNDITVLAFGNDNINDIGFLEISKNKRIKTIIYEGKLNTQSISALAKNTSILNLVFFSMESVDEEGLELFANMGQLKGLYIYNSDITQAGVKAIAKINQLESLELDNCNLKDKHLPIIAAMTKLKFLSLSNYEDWKKVLRNKFGQKGMNAFQNNKTIEELYLIDTHLDDQAAESLAKNTSIERLFVRFNDISDQGAEALALNTVIRTLSLEKNNIHNDGAYALAKTNTLDHLRIRDNPIGSEGVAALKANTHIKILDIDDESEDTQAKSSSLFHERIKTKFLRYKK